MVVRSTYVTLIAKLHNCKLLFLLLFKMGEYYSRAMGQGWGGANEIRKEERPTGNKVLYTFILKITYLT